ncbi:MAG: FemAB family protein, partial [Cytophagaceae bacterium]
IDYQLAYIGDGVSRAEDASVILFHDNRPAGVWPIMIMTQPDGRSRICSHGGPVLPPVFSRKLAAKSARTLTIACIEATATTWKQFDQNERTCLHCFDSRLGLNDWHDQWMVRSARVNTQHDLFVDLQRPLAEIRNSFRKSFKPLISQGMSLWNASVVTEADESQWDEFHNLHIAVAGRATRSDESWQRQLSAISSGDAFFVVLRDIDSRMVGAALFHTTRDEGLYAVGAYDRSLFHKPLSHVVQFLSIGEMVRRGVKWYRLGVRTYSGDSLPPSSKDLSISDFKQGFASHLIPRFILQLS